MASILTCLGDTGDAGSISAKLTVRRTGRGGGDAASSPLSSAPPQKLRDGERLPGCEDVRSALATGARACNDDRRMLGTRALDVEATRTGSFAGFLSVLQAGREVLLAISAPGVPGGEGMPL